MPDIKTLLVTGGCRCGKSGYAQAWAEAKNEQRVYVATAQIMDQEMSERVRAHIDARGHGWSTREEPLRVPELIQELGAGNGVVLLDCLTLWINNMLFHEYTDLEILTAAEELVHCVVRANVPIVLVSNEVGMGLVPEHALSRRFRDLAGTVNQLAATAVDQVVLMVSGQPLVVK